MGVMQKKRVRSCRDKHTEGKERESKKQKERERCREIK